MVHAKDQLVKSVINAIVHRVFPVKYVSILYQKINVNEFMDLLFEWFYLNDFF